jgi:hypothetical protein
VAAKRKRNPLARGYSRATVSANIARLRREGMPAERAAAAALRSARQAWRARHKTGPFPAHLRPVRANPKRRRRPSSTAPALRAGYSSDVVRANVATLRRAGDSLEAATLRALRRARRDFRKRSRAAFPPHLALPGAEQQRAFRAELGRAARLYRGFHRREPSGVARAQVDKPQAAMRLGRLEGVIYRSDHGPTYLHKFKGSARPLLVASADGSRLYVVGGRYRMTRRGIVDRS